MARSIGAPSESDVPSIAPSVAPSIIAATAAETGSGAEGDENASVSQPSESFIHASQVVQSGAATESAENGATLAVPKPKKSKLQLWNEVKIDCECVQKARFESENLMSDSNSNFSSLYVNLHTISPHAPHAHPAQPPWPPNIPRFCRFTGIAP